MNKLFFLKICWLHDSSTSSSGSYVLILRESHVLQPKVFTEFRGNFTFATEFFFLPLNEVPSSVGTSALYCRSYWLEQQSMFVRHRSRRSSYQQTDKKWAKVLLLLHAAAAASVSEACLLVHRLLFQTWLLTSAAGSRKAATADCCNLPSAASDLFFLSFFLPAHLSISEAASSGLF